MVGIVRVIFPVGRRYRRMALLDPPAPLKRNKQKIRARPRPIPNRVSVLRKKQRKDAEMQRRKKIERS